MRRAIPAAQVFGRRGVIGPGSDITGAEIEAQLASVPQRVADALADDNTVALAAADAVDDELAARDLVESSDGRMLRDMSSDEFLWAVVDLNKRRALAITMAGEVVGNFALTEDNLPDGLSFPKEIMTGAGLSLAAVDEAGKIGELALDHAGKVPQWILDRWAERMSVDVPTETLSIELPSRVYVVTGTEHQLIHSHYIKALSADHRVKAANVENGGNSYNDRWKITPVSAQSDNLTVTVSDRHGTQVATKTTSIVASSDTGLSSAVRLLPIGDSITRTGTYAKTATDLLGGVCVGTRKVGSVFSEGRPGWTMANYATRVASLISGDSPFLFPAGVAAERYRGNTNAWANIVGPTGTTDSVYNGFQQIARPGFATSGAFMFDPSGYPTSPVEGDVVVDPLQSSGNEWRQYVSGSWTTIAAPTMEVDFTKYMTRFADAFAGGNPTVISIMLGTNDFFSTIDETAFATFAGRIDALIASIRVWSATVPIAVCIPPIGGYQDDWAGKGYTTHKFEYEDRMLVLSELMRQHYDTDAKRTDKVYLTTFLGSVDDDGFETSNTVHPNTAGHVTMGAMLAGTIAHVLD